MTKKERREAREAAKAAEARAKEEAARKALEQKDTAEEEKIKYNNDIGDIRTMRQLEKVNLDFESPRLK